MNVLVKSFKELTKEELFQIFKLRVSVFIVEQNCAYQEIDEWDIVSHHVLLKEDDEILGYLRILPPNTVFDSVSLGRVIAVKRRQGIGTKLVAEGIEAAKRLYQPKSITIEPQTYAKGLYEKLGFQQTSDEFLEDGIPHIQMKLHIKPQ